VKAVRKVKHVNGRGKQYERSNMWMDYWLSIYVFLVRLCLLGPVVLHSYIYVSFLSTEFHEKHRVYWIPGTSKLILCCCLTHPAEFLPEEPERTSNGKFPFCSPGWADDSIHKFHHQQVLKPTSAGCGGQPTKGSPPGTGHLWGGCGTAHHKSSHAPAVGLAERCHASRLLYTRYLQVPVSVCWGQQRSSCESLYVPIQGELC